MKQYVAVCPYCGSEKINMIGDSEYNDFWECEKCKESFNSFKNKEVEI